MQTITELIDICHKIAKEHGWWSEPREDGTCVALMHSELSEALEALRNNDSKEHVSEELADCLIRIFDFCGQKEIDLETALHKKIAFNRTRPYRHGKKF